jgi:hypothetical protein
MTLATKEMTATTSKLGADMLTDEQEIELRALILEYGLAAVIEGDQDRPRQLNRVVDYVRALLARQPAAIDKAATLDKPAQVSGTRFGKGVQWSTVIGAAQRYYEFMQTPEKEALRIENARRFIEGLAAPLANEASKPAPSVEQDERGAFEAWYALENENARTHLEGDDWRELEPEQRDNYLAAFRAGVSYRARAASTSANVAQGSAWGRVRYVRDTFKKDLEQGFKTKDKIFAVDLLTKALDEQEHATNVAQGAEADNAERQQAYETGYQHGISLTQYTAAMGDAAEAYFSQFKNAHPLPAQFRWSEVYDAMRSLAAPPAQTALTDAARDAARYRLMRRGQHWSVIDGIGDTLRGEKLDAAIDAALTAAQSASGDTK